MVPRVLLSVLVVVFGFMGHVQAMDAKLIAFLGIPKTAKADVMTVSMDSRAVGISKRVAEAVKQNQEWFAEYVRGNADAYPLPYHANMGVTEDEYGFLLTASERMSLMKTGETRLGFTTTPTEYVLSFHDDYAGLGSVRIRKDLSSLGSVYGIHDGVSDVDNTDPDSPTGVWAGKQWKLDTIADPDNPKGIVSTFSLGMKPNGTGIVYFKTLSFVPGDEYRFDFLFMFGL